MKMAIFISIEAQLANKNTHETSWHRLDNIKGRKLCFFLKKGSLC